MVMLILQLNVYFCRMKSMNDPVCQHLYPLWPIIQIQFQRPQIPMPNQQHPPLVWVSNMQIRKNKTKNVPNFNYFFSLGFRHTHRCFLTMYPEYFRCYFIYPADMGRGYSWCYMRFFNCTLLLLCGTLHFSRFLFRFSLRG